MWACSMRLRHTIIEFKLKNGGVIMKIIWELEKLEYIHHALQEVISDSNKMGDHLIDLDMIEKAIEFVEDIREPFFKK